MRYLLPFLALALIGCDEKPDPALVDNPADAGLVSANAQNEEMKRQAGVFVGSTQKRNAGRDDRADGVE